MMKILANRKVFLFFVAIVCIYIIFITLRDIVTSSFPFWYDPARDLGLAQENLQKIRLIGPPSGIPGFFYGPYWIWLLSVGMLFSSDPRVIVFISGFLLYCVALPFIIFKSSKYIGGTYWIFLWVLFMLSFGERYATQLWNPYPASLLVVTTICLILYAIHEKHRRKRYLLLLFSGIGSGLVINFHISFGIAFSVGILLFFLLQIFLEKETVKKIKSKIIDVILVIIGIFIAFIPTLFFEVRHGFNQIKTFLLVITSSGAVVGLKGMQKDAMVEEFFKKGAELLHISLPIFFLLATLIVIYFFMQVRRHKIQLNKEDMQPLLLILSITIGMACLYMTSKNPVWDYHFIGVEILFLIVLGVVIKKDRFLAMILGVWISVLVLLSSFSIYSARNESIYKESSLRTKEYIVQTIYENASNKPFSVFVYSPSIYTFDYDYIFTWYAQKDNKKIPSHNASSSAITYLIIPKTKKEVKEDFINYRTPNGKYKTVYIWNIPDGTSILKRTYIKQ